MLAEPLSLDSFNDDRVQSDRERYERLTERERSVLRLVAQGYSAPEIGVRLSISPKTVDTYKQRIQAEARAHASIAVRSTRASLGFARGRLRGGMIRTARAREERRRRRRRWFGILTLSLIALSLTLTEALEIARRRLEPLAIRDAVGAPMVSDRQLRANAGVADRNTYRRRKSC